MTTSSASAALTKASRRAGLGAGGVQPVSDAADPPHDCPACPRLVAFRMEWRATEPDWFNAPVPTFTAPEADVRLLVVGLAPGIRGANRTGRPFTGDFAGDLLYSTLTDRGLARGRFAARPDDGLRLVRTAITNAVRCVPPENKPTGAEIRSCRPWLQQTIRRFSGLRAVVALGRVAHETVLSATGVARGAAPFSHGGEHALPGDIRLFDSYHCSRYNTNTGRLTEAMFHAVFDRVVEHIGPA